MFFWGGQEKKDILKVTGERGVATEHSENSEEGGNDDSDKQKPVINLFRLQLSQSLQAQQVTAQNTIQLLKLKVTKLQLTWVMQAKVDKQHQVYEAAIKYYPLLC